MKIKLLGLVVASLMLVAGQASALVLSLEGAGGTGSTLPGNFNPTGFPGGLVIPGTTPITVYTAADVGSGLSADSAGQIKLEYLGSEAGFTDTFNLGVQLFSNATSAVGTVAFADVAAGIIPFLFQTSGGGGKTAANGGFMSPGVSIAFADLGDGSFLAMFNDGGGGDFDYDDLAVRVSVSAVPLPAAAWLLLSAVLGLVSFSRIRRNGAQTA